MVQQGILNYRRFSNMADIRFAPKLARVGTLPTRFDTV
jgi:hypothetical protein